MSTHSRAARPAKARPRTPLAAVAASALIVGGVGILVQIASGAAYPAVPPGLLMLLVAAALVWFVPWRWIPLVGALVAGWQVVGLFASGRSGQLWSFSPVGDSIGLWIQLVAAAVAVVAGIAAVVTPGRAPTS